LWLVPVLPDFLPLFNLIELGLKPIVIERGKDVRGRRRDLKAINR
jgi:hypothetical protein